MSGLKVTINSKGLVYSVILLLASVMLTVRAHVDDQLSVLRKVRLHCHRK